MNLNQGQQEAADAFYDFLLDPNAKEFIISGPAGVGKTFLMRHLQDVVMPRYHKACEVLGIKPDYVEVEMTATTNKAAEVLTQSTGRECSTVHSFFNLRVFDDYKTGETKVSRTKEWRVHQGKVIFIDECSMMDTPLWRHTNDGTVNCKRVYVGDHLQMAPVLESLSPVYKQGSPMFVLTEPVRNAGQPALMALCAQYRRTVEEGLWQPLRCVPGVIEHLDDDAMQRHLHDAFMSKDASARVLAFTNDRVIQYVQHIREEVRGLPPTFTRGEHLVLASAYSKDKDILNVEQVVTVLDELGETGAVIEGPKAVRMFDVDADFPEVNQLPQVTLRVGVIRIMARGKVLEVEYPLDRSHYKALLKHYRIKQEWAPYYRLKNQFADLRPVEACTVYKAQGSTYDTVYVDLADISRCPNPNQAARMLYVAFSRAREKVYLYGELDPRFGGPVVGP